MATKNSILRVFRNVNMSYQHDSLKAVARKAKVDISNLGAGEHVLFLNAKLTRVKMYSANEVISYYRAPDNSRVDLRIIEQIPSCFKGAAGMDWQQAERQALEKALSKYEEKKLDGEAL